jgi:hypothetical protein
VRRLVVLAGLAVALVGVAGCNNSTGGQPSAAATTAGSPPESTSPSAGGGNALPVDRACSLLSAGDLSSLGVSSAPTQGTVGTAHTCEADNATDHIIVGIRTNVGLSGFVANGGTVHDLTIGTHQAKQEVDNTGSCLIGIGVSSSSRVDVTVTGDGTTDPCPTAMNVAKLVEPKLP